MFQGGAQMIWVRPVLLILLMLHCFPCTGDNHFWGFCGVYFYIYYTDHIMVFIYTCLLCSSYDVSYPPIIYLLCKFVSRWKSAGRIGSRAHENFTRIGVVNRTEAMSLSFEYQGDLDWKKGGLSTAETVASQRFRVFCNKKLCWFIG